MSLSTHFNLSELGSPILLAGNSSRAAQVLFRQAISDNRSLGHYIHSIGLQQTCEEVEHVNVCLKDSRAKTSSLRLYCDVYNGRQCTQLDDDIFIVACIGGVATKAA